MNPIQEPQKETVHYREQALRAAAAGEKKSTCYWRLAADEAAKIARQHHGNNILISEKLPFIDHLAHLAQSTQEANYHLQKENLPHWLFAKEECHDALVHYRYWMAYAKVSSSRNFEREISQTTEAVKKYYLIIPKVAVYAQQAADFFKKTEHYQQLVAKHYSLLHELAAHHWKAAAQEAAHVANIYVQEAEVAKEKNEVFLHHWAMMTRFSEQALCLRIKAAEAMEKQEEEQALDYSLAAYALNRASEGLLTMMKVLLTGRKSLALEWQEATALAKKIAEYRLKKITSRTTPGLATRSWDDASHWLENALEAHLKMIEAEEQEYKRIAAYWHQSCKASKQAASSYLKAAPSTISWNRIINDYAKRVIRHAEKKAQKKIPLMLLEKISFCLYENYLPSPAWKERWKKGKFVSFDERNKSVTVHAWIYQTWSFLQEAGIACDLFTQMPHLPPQGIFITMSGFLRDFKILPSLQKNTFLVDIIADAGTPHPAASLHLVPNSACAQYSSRTLFMPHWPQPFLIPRNPERGLRFENICFMGDLQSIAPELCSQQWRERLEKELGLHFSHRDSGRWHDFSDVDCVVAIRGFSRSRFLYKPASKLYNAWLAGVPFIGGCDSAYAADGRKGHDYLRATSAEETFQHLKRLKEDPIFRTILIQNGLQSGTAFTKQAILQQWKRLLQETLPASALQWQQSSKLQRACRILIQRVNCKTQSLFYQFYHSKKYQLIKGERESPFAWNNQDKL